MGMYNGWSRLIQTDLGRLAEINYTADPRRTYHNWNHILCGFEHAANFGYEYDVNLDAAWIGHDWVYDERPDKELRSIDAFHEVLSKVSPISGLDMNVVDALIESSINHSLVNDTRLIRMDLADLTIKEKAASNYELIATESQELYGITREMFAQGSVEFMSKMRTTMMTNAKLDPEGGTFWSLVLRGVDQTISMSEEVLA